MYEYTIDMGAISYAILPGHRLRLEVSSRDFPQFDRNLNTRPSPEQGTTIAVEHQTIDHDAQHPSRAILPQIPMGGGGGRGASAAALR